MELQTPSGYFCVAHVLVALSFSSHDRPRNYFRRAGSADLNGNTLQVHFLRRDRQVHIEWRYEYRIGNYDVLPLEGLASLLRCGVATISIFPSENFVSQIPRCFQSNTVPTAQACVRVCKKFAIGLWWDILILQDCECVDNVRGMVVVS